MPIRSKGEICLSNAIVIYGAGGHAKAVIDTVEQEGRYQIIGLLDGHKPVGSFIYDYQVLGDENWLAAHSHKLGGILVAIGDNWTRSVVVRAIRAIAPELPFVSAVHPCAVVARGAVIGAGSVVMAGAIIGSDTTIGEHNVLYTHASIDHDSATGHYVTLAPKAGTGGQVHIGDYSVLSLAAAVIHNVTIGKHTVVGAGATVLRNLPSYTVAYGSPAKEIRSREAGTRYL
jgi:sugar O-acyltransferase (sialic acid O-acetyltransferase NeuD family)